MHAPLLWGVGLALLVMIRILARPKRRLPTRSRTERRNVRAGQVGESRTVRVFRQAFGPARVWPDVHVAHGSRTSQCDCLVAGPFGLVVVEVKHWTGDLDRLDAAHWRQVKADGTHHVYASPEAQNAYHAQVVQAVLRQHGLGRVPVYAAIVLSNPHAAFWGSPGAQPIGTPDAVAAWIQRLPPAPGDPPDPRVESVLRASGAEVNRAVPWG